MKFLAKFKEPLLFALIAIAPNALFLLAGPLYMATHLISGGAESLLSRAVLWWGLHPGIVLGATVAIAAIASLACERRWPTAPLPTGKAAHP